MRKEQQYEDTWTHDRRTCTCVRCTGFLPGHKINEGNPREDLTRHGAYKSPLVLRPEAEKIADLIRPLLPVAHPAFEGTLQSYCITLARIQRAHDALEDAEAKMAEDPEFVPAFNTMSLAEDLRRWQNSARKDAEALGLTPMSAARIMKDAEIGNLAAKTALSREAAAQMSSQALVKVRAAIQEALLDDDILDAEIA